MIKNFLCTIFLLISLLNLYSSPIGWENNMVIVKSNGFKPVIVCYRNNIFVSYLKQVLGHRQVFLISSTNDGKNWLLERQITPMSSYCDTPRILYVNNKIYIFWVDFRDGNNEIYFTYSKDNLGTKFEEPVRITFTSSDSIQPFVTSTGDKIVLIWSDDKKGDYELFAKIYVISENKWSEDVQITTYSGGSFYPYAIPLLDEIHLVWQKKESDRWKIMYSKSDDGKKWTKPIEVSAGLNSGYEPMISYSRDGLKVIFQGEKDFEFEIYMNSYEELSEHWLIPMKITRDINIEHSPHLISTVDKLYAFWFDYSEGNNEILCSSSTDEGLLWSEKINLSETKGDSHNFNVTYNSFNDNIYLVWEEDYKGTIMFKKGDKFCPTPIIVASSHKSNEWAFENNLFFKLRIDADVSGIKDFAYIIDDKPDTIPDLFVAQYPVDEAKFYNLKDGIWYFHLRARDNVGNVSETVHYPVKINSKLYLEKVKYYVVKYGDTLWDISNKHYKNPRLYKKIADYNQIKNPKWIYPHQVIKIPPKELLEK